jgi:arginine decarboxylase
MSSFLFYRCLLLENCLFLQIQKAVDHPLQERRREMITVPRMVFLTKGAGKHKEQLSSFELALRNARVAHFNLVRVSSIFPPRCKLVPRNTGLRYLKDGQIVYSVMSSNSTNEPNRLVSASVGIAIPNDPTKYGYLAEHKAFGQTFKKAGDYAEDLAATMLATTLGIDFDVDKGWDERKQQWKISGQIVRTTNATQSAEGDKNGLWTSVVAAAIFVPL